MALKPFTPRPVVSLASFPNALIALTPCKLVTENINGDKIDGIIADLVILDGDNAGHMFAGARILNPSIVDALNLDVDAHDTYVGRVQVKLSNAGNPYVTLAEPTADDITLATAHFGA